MEGSQPARQPVDLNGLRTSERRYRRLLEEGWDGLLLLGRDRHIEVLKALPGVPLVEPDATLSWIHPDDREAALATAGRAAGAPGGVTSLEHRVVAADGAECWVETTFKNLLEDPDVAALVMVQRDVTERRAAQEALRSVERDALPHEKLRIVGQMAAGIAHDLNQALALIVGYAEIAQGALEPEPADLATARDALAVATRAAVDGGRTVARLLTFARPPDEKIAERVSVLEALQEVARLTAPRWRDAAAIEGRAIRLGVEGDRALEIEVSPTGLREAVTNLVFNAVDALPRGGDVRLTVERREGRVAVAVADSGVGMPADVRARIFEPFFTTKGRQGTGLGLGQVLAFVEQHRGEVAVESAPGAGTTLTMTFPEATDARRPAKPAPSAPGTAGHGRRRVLLVEDEPDLLRGVKKLLERRGHTIVAVASGEEALAVLEGWTPDAVLSDLGLGTGMNGWELARRVRERWASLRFVLATGWGAQIEEGAARDAGVDAVVAKPYTGADLVAALVGGPMPARLAHAVD
jgi:signal transduction histidine kinase/ActR/RegA family two-component response regulator